MKRFIDRIQELAAGRTVLILVLVTLAVYAAILLYTIPSVLELAPEMKLFDMSPTGYSLDYARSLLEAIGERVVRPISHSNYPSTLSIRAFLE